MRAQDFFVSETLPGDQHTVKPPTNETVCQAMKADTPAKLNPLCSHCYEIPVMKCQERQAFCPENLPKAAKPTPPKLRPQWKRSTLDWALQQAQRYGNRADRVARKKAEGTCVQMIAYIFSSRILHSLDSIYTYNTPELLERHYTFL